MHTHYELLNDSTVFEICVQAESRTDPIAFFIDGEDMMDAVNNALMRSDVQQKIANYPTERFWVSIIPVKQMRRLSSTPPGASAEDAHASTAPPAAPTTAPPAAAPTVPPSEPTTEPTTAPPAAG